MGRELRPRKSRPSYAALLRLEGDEAGPSMSARELEEAEGDSESDFAPDIAVQSAAEDEDEDDADADELDEEDAPAKAESPTPVSRPATKRKPQEQTRNAKGKGKEVGTKFAIEPRPRATVQLAPGLSRPLNRQMYALPMPSSNHRHRAAPIFRRQGNVERLLSPPKLFSAPSVTSSPNFTAHPAVMNRLGKAWGFNVGPGPLWDLMEDRAWYKEAVCGTENEEWEGNRRPRVFFDLAMPVGMRLLTREEASAYLPSDVVTTEEGDLRPPPPVRCFFGPYGKQTKHEMNIFDTLRISEHIPGSKAHVFNAGAPVWGLDWCPIHADDRPHRSYKQYLAAAPFPSRSHSPDIGAKVSRPSYACIQIWSLSPPEDVEMVDATAAPPGDDDFDPGHMRCEMVLCVESGPAHELKWCPLPSHDSLARKDRDNGQRKLGLLAGTFEDGSLSIYAVPDPDSTPANSDANQPKFVHISEPFLLIELEETSCMTLDWANSEIIAVGCTNGSIAVYNVGEAIRQGVRSNLLPIYYMSIHQSAIRGLSWVRVPPASTSGAPLTGEDPTVIASGGYDGLECLTDIRDPHGNVFNRTRDVINCITYSTYAGGVITIDHENIVKVYQTAPSMLGRGHTLIEPGGPVWGVNVSDYHTQLAVACADGACSTTNTLRPTRRGGAVPFFIYKIYQLDFSRKTGEYRMLEQFLPQETQDRPTATRAQRQGQSVQVIPVGTGVWPAEVGVQRVVWNSGNGLANAPLLASSTGSGLCRVDWLMGRWMKDKVPYGGVEAMREAAHVDEDDDDNDE